MALTKDNIQEGNLLVIKWQELLDQIYKFISYYPKAILDTVIKIIGSISICVLLFYPMYTDNLLGFSDGILFMISIFGMIFVSTLFLLSINKLPSLIIDSIFYPFKFSILRIQKQIQNIVQCLNDEKNPIDTLDEVTNIISDIYKFINTLIGWNSIMKKAIRYHSSGYENMMRNTVAWILIVLMDLQNQLAGHIQHHKILLESAKSEIEKNIHGTTELDSISELQRARLDRQIEQFEELQRVMVKV